MSDTDEPDRPTEMPKAGWVAILKRALKQFKHDDVTDRAAALTYFGVLALFPGMLVYQGVLGTIFRVEGAGDSVLDAAITAFCLSMGGILGQYLASEALWATRRRQFRHNYPDRVFRKEMADEANFSDIMVPIFSKPFTQ